LSRPDAAAAAAGAPASPEGLRALLVDRLLPLWRDHGVDRERGGFYSRIGRGPAPLTEEPRRLLVQTRQVYVLSLASQAGAGSWTADLAAQGAEVLLRDFWDDEHGGFVLATTPDGEPLDRRKDLYAHAFVLLALSARHFAASDRAARPLATRTLALLEDRLADDVNGGFFEGGDSDWTPLDEPRRQNPHMHLLEAALAWLEHDPDGPWLGVARRLLDLLEQRFVEPGSGLLREYFEDDWSQRGDDRGRITEPGHHFEWVWLLHEHARLTGEDRGLDLARRLFERGAASGIDPEHGGVYDEVDVDGHVRRDSKRLWPQTEYLRALAVRGDLRVLRPALETFLERYADPATGGFRERLQRDGAPISREMNATSVYHLWTSLPVVAAALGGA